MFEALGGNVMTVPLQGSAVLRAGGEWRDSDTPGFLVKTLVEDSGAGLRAYLMKSEPGASSSLHSHASEIEQIYVLEGHFRDGEATYGPGDYILRAPGAPHLTVCEEGSISLVTYSLDGRRQP